MIDRIPSDIAIGDVFLKHGGCYTHAVYIGELNEENRQIYLDLKIDLNRSSALRLGARGRRVFILFGQQEIPSRFILDAVTDDLENFKLEYKILNFEYPEVLKPIESIVNQFRPVGKKANVEKRPDFMIPGNIYSEKFTDWKWICIENWVEKGVRRDFELNNIDISRNEEVNGNYPYTCICWRPTKKEIFIGFFSKDGLMNPSLNDPKSLIQETKTQISNVSTAVLKMIYKNNLLPNIFKKPELVPGKTFRKDDWNYTIIENFSNKEFDAFGISLNRGDVGKNKEEFPFTTVIWSSEKNYMFIDNCDENGFVLTDGERLSEEWVPCPLPERVVAVLDKAKKKMKVEHLENGDEIHIHEKGETIDFRVCGTYTWGGRGSHVTILCDWDNRDKFTHLFEKHFPRLRQVSQPVLLDPPKFIAVRWSGGGAFALIVMDKTGTMEGDNIVTGMKLHLVVMPKKLPESISNFLKESQMSEQKETPFKFGETYCYDGEWFFTVVDDISNKDFENFGLKLNHGQVGKSKDFPIIGVVWKNKGEDGYIWLESCNIEGRSASGDPVSKTEVRDVTLPTVITDILKKTQKDVSNVSGMPPWANKTGIKTFYLLSYINQDSQLVSKIRCLNSNMEVCKWDKENVPAEMMRDEFGKRIPGFMNFSRFNISFENYLKVNGWKNVSVDDEIDSLKTKILANFGCQRTALEPHYNSFLETLKYFYRRNNSVTFESITVMRNVLGRMENQMVSKARGGFLSDSVRIEKVANDTMKMLELYERKSNEETSK